MKNESGSAKRRRKAILRREWVRTLRVKRLVQRTAVETEVAEFGESS